MEDLISEKGADECLQAFVRAGCFSDAEIIGRVCHAASASGDEGEDGDIDEFEDGIRAQLASARALHTIDAESWAPGDTDVDRLWAAFDRLRGEGICVSETPYGLEHSDGTALAEYARGWPWCWFNEQDLARAVTGGVLRLRYLETAGASSAARSILAALSLHGLGVASHDEAAACVDVRMRWRCRGTHRRPAPAPRGAVSSSSSAGVTTGTHMEPPPPAPYPPWWPPKAVAMSRRRRGGSGSAASAPLPPREAAEQCASTTAEAVHARSRAWFKDQTCVLTGFRDGTLETAIKAAGGRIAASMNKSVTCVISKNAVDAVGVAGSGAAVAELSNKARMALTRGLALVPALDAYAILGRAAPAKVSAGGTLEEVVASRAGGAAAAAGGAGDDGRGSSAAPPMATAAAAVLSSRDSPPAAYDKEKSASAAAQPTEPGVDGGAPTSQAAPVAGGPKRRRKN